LNSEEIKPIALAIIELYLSEGFNKQDFMKTIPSGSVKIIGKIITDNQY